MRVKASNLIKVMGAIIIILSISVLFVSCLGGKTIDAANLYEYEISGFDGNGKISVRSSDEYIEKILSSNSDLGMALLSANIGFEASERDGLSNGDEIEIEVIYNKDILKEKGIKLKNTSAKVKVSGLEKTTKVDPFENITISYIGTSPYVEVAVDASANDDFIQNNISFVPSTEQLSKGETFTLTANFYEDNIISEGYEITKIEQEYTVDDVAFYLSTLDDIDIKDLQAEINDILESKTAVSKEDSYFGGVYIGYNEIISEKSSKLKSSYLLSLKKQHEGRFSSYTNYNRLIQVYEHKLKLADGEKTMYSIVYADNLSHSTEGDLNWEAQLGFKAAENYDELLKDFVTAQKEYYNVAEVK